ncbi:geranylgeranyl transferase type-2 subunit alpha 1 isoform X1 [Apium graveolens]|uniref:geranylgeranyl transferase type-2 subunit alpha 1 isoform X1 n=2 Tax=Apium graveolens TaxID=4045 RepID=UPI003D790EE3
MHGRPRKALTREDGKALAAKAAKLRSLQSQFLHFHQNKIYTTEAVEVSAKLLEANPEFYTAWNYRKLAVQNNLASAQSSDSDGSINSILDEELKVAENALKKNYKSYGAWHHRTWVLSKGHSSTDRELRLLNMFQKQDSRNFHAWNYRRFVTALRNISKEEELQFTTDMINDNFSNYSAWHNRSVLLSHLLEEKAQGYSLTQKVLEEEYEFVRNALFTDPDDQSGWFYHLWLLSQTVKHDRPLLLSTWPPNGSDVHVPANCSIEGFAPPRTTTVHSSAVYFPVVLYFSEAVRGVNSTTVTIKVEFDTDSDLKWRPLSANVYGCAQAWVAYINCPDGELHAPKTYPVKLKLGHSQGITSLNGTNYNHLSSIAFKVSMLPSDSIHRENIGKRTSWKDVDVIPYETNHENSSLLDMFFNLSINEGSEATASKWQAEAIASEIAHYRELLSFSNCKIGKLTLARLLIAHDAMISRNSPNASSVVNSEEVLGLYQDLIKMDPAHSEYYKDEYSSVLLKKVTSSRESLLCYCHQYKKSTSTEIGDLICLRLAKLSISRIGSFEKLLWVRLLDLSHNNLQSVEGLEALQLLSHLNLSNNRLSSFTALDPLKFLKSLDVLDISFNEIGAHTVDTRRYLCSSPLSHTSDWNLEELTTSGMKNVNYWEAYSTFKCIGLTELDLRGNAVVNENFRLFVSNLMPKLKWLDGEELH